MGTPVLLLTPDPNTRRLNMGDDEKQAEIDRKKADVRARLEAQAAGKKAKKGFMTPERKKKLRVIRKLTLCFKLIMFI